MSFLLPLRRAYEYALRPSDYFAPPEFTLWRYLRHAAAWSAAVAREGRVSGDEGATLTVVLLSYLRVRNIEPMLWALLKAAFVGKIIVSNNNPRVRLRDWVRLRDKRLELIDQSRPTAPGIRFELARRSGGEFFLSIDDDVFVTAAQAKALFGRLRRDPLAPHGIKGEVFAGPPHSANEGSVGTENCEAQVDVLNELYAFDRTHLERAYALAQTLGIDLACVENGEDVLLSAAGPSRPRLHDVGTVLKCPSAYRRGVATWATRADFFRERRGLFERATAVRARALP